MYMMWTAIWEYLGVIELGKGKWLQGDAVQDKIQHLLFISITESYI